MPQNRSRINITNRQSTGGGTVIVGDATVKFGPDFGEKAGNDGRTHLVHASMPVISTVRFDTELSHTSSIDHSVTFSYQVNLLNSSLAMSSASFGVDWGNVGSVEELVYFIPEIPTDYDTWVGDSAGCLNDNANHNGEALSVDGSALTAKKAILGWELGGFPPNAQFISAFVNVTVASLQLTDQAIELTLVEDETWDETTVICNNKPAEGAVASSAATVPGTLSGGAVGDRLSFPIDISAAFTRLASRMGVGRFSIHITGPITSSLVTFDSSETAATSADAPTLTLRFSTPN